MAKGQVPKQGGKICRPVISPQGARTQHYRHATNTHHLPDPPAHSPSRQCVPGKASSTTINWAGRIIKLQKPVIYLKPHLRDTKATNHCNQSSQNNQSG